MEILKKHWLVLAIFVLVVMVAVKQLKGFNIPVLSDTLEKLV